jgi:GAF domain-containing protein
MKSQTRKEFFDEQAQIRQSLLEMASREAQARQRIAELEAGEAKRQQTLAALERRVERLNLLRAIEEAALTEQPMRAIAQTALDHMKELVPYQRATVALFDFEARQAQVLAAALPEDDEHGEGVQYALEAIGTEKSRALERGESIVVDDGSNYPLGPKVARALKAERVPSCIGVPLVAGGTSIGVLNVWAAGPDAFSAEDLQVIHLVAAVLAMTIYQAMHHEQMERHARELVALYNSAQAMLSLLDLQSVLKSVIIEAKTLLEAEGASVLLPAGDALVFEAAVGPGADVLVGKRIPIYAGIAGWVMKHKQPVRMNDVQRDPRFYSEMDKLTGLVSRCILAVPIISKDVINGVIEVVNKVDGASRGTVFYEEDLEILVAMAGPAAIALENARLYQARSSRKRARAMA